MCVCVCAYIERESDLSSITLKSRENQVILKADNPQDFSLSTAVEHEPSHFQASSSSSSISKKLLFMKDK